MSEEDQVNLYWVYDPRGREGTWWWDGKWRRSRRTCGPGQPKASCVALLVYDDRFLIVPSGATDEDVTLAIIAKRIR